jgi:toxin ParE1/3/4
VTNKNKIIRLLPAAEEDLSEIILYVSLDSPEAARNLLFAIEASLLRLRLHPYMGRVPHEEELLQQGYRFLIVRNYLAFYTVEDRTIFVHRILHGARDYLTLL